MVAISKTKEINNVKMMDIPRNLTMIKDIRMIVETLLMIVVVLTRIINHILMIHKAIMEGIININLPMIHKAIMEGIINISLPMIHKAIMEKIINISLPIIQEMNKENLAIKEITVDRISKIVEVLRTLIISFSQIIKETQIISFRQDKGFQQKN